MQPILQKTQLIRNGSLIGGEWASPTGESGDASAIEVYNPATGQLITALASGGRAQAELAVDAAIKAGEVWRNTSAKKRCHVLKAWHRLILDNVNDLASILTAEQGKPLTEAKAEILYGANYVEWFAEQAKRVEGSVIPAPSGGQRIVTVRQPVGVVAAITPWNFPMAMLARKIAPALAAGCTVVAKPAKETPLSALALAYLAEEAGIPAGVINMVIGQSSADIGDVFTTHAAVKKLTFTGSTEVGRALLAQSAATIKNTSMELGGNAPFIVFDDADIEQAVAGCMSAKFRNAGQTCVCVNRIFVHASVKDAFVAKLLDAVAKLKVGDGAHEGVDVGPLINAAAFAKVSDLVIDACEKGAKVIVADGHSHLVGELFYPPTVITDSTVTMNVFSQEIFGPVAVVYGFSSEEEVIALANDTPFGLAGYFYSRDIGRVWRVADALDVGMVGINDTAISNEMAPFGGIKESGFGREGAQQGLDDYLETKYILMGGLS